MRSVFTLLNKGLIIPFYKMHAGLFLFIFFVMFGVVESNQLVHYHRSLIESMFVVPLFRAGVFIVWMLYVIKILHFLLQLLRQPQYAILHNLMLLPRTQKIVALLNVSILCFMPVLVYSIFIYSIGVQQHYFELTFLIAIGQILLCTMLTGTLYLFIQTRHRISWAFFNRVRVPAIGGRIGMYFAHIVQHEKIGLILSKTFSIATLYIVKETLTSGDDVQFVLITWLFALLAHTFIIVKIKLFEDQHLMWVNHLPISISRIAGMYVLLYALLMMPEWILLASVVEHGIDMIHYAILPVFSGAWLSFVHVYLFKPNRDPDKFTTFLFWVFILSFLFVLSKLIIVLTLGLLILGFILLSKRYYAYEPIVMEDSTS